MSLVTWSSCTILFKDQRKVLNHYVYHLKWTWWLFIINTTKEMAFEWEAFMQLKLLQAFNLNVYDENH
jgi:hypothetical protein